MTQRTFVAGCLVAALVGAGGALAAWGGEKHAKPAKGEPASGGSPAASAASPEAGSGISVSTVNGQTTVTYKGEAVFKGATSGPVSAHSSSVNGAEYAAAFDGKKVLWENTSGAAEKLTPGAAALPESDRAPKKKAAKKRRSEP